MNVIELLKADHKVVAGLFKEVENSPESAHPEIFAKIKTELDTHTHIEETLFYPKLKAEGDKALVDITLEGIEEHHQVKMFLKEIAALTGKAEEFEPKLKVLIEDVEHHVKEEESEMFPLVKAQFKSDVLDKLGAEMEKEKENYKKSHSAAAAGK